MADAPPLVLLHGFSGAPATFAETIARLPLGRPMRAWALPGHDGEPPVESFDAAVDALAERIGEAPIHVVGYSMGARLALGLCVRHPALVARATLIGVHPGLSDDAELRERAEEDARWARLIEEDLERFAAAWEEQPVLAVRSPVPPARLAAHRALRLRHDPAALARTMLTLGLAAMPDYGPVLSGIAVPVDLVVGELDDKFRPIAESMIEQIPSARLHVIPGCGHNVPLEHPAALAALLGGPPA
jgi:2-succinyl-6-hydroxy-2,4-cyclohexadiene-1-carboxylate synthase